jgi:glucosamine-6-phosphate deaminase
MNPTPSSPFTFEPAAFVPFRDRAVVAGIRALHGEALTRHPNPDYRIRLVPDAEMDALWVDDIVRRIRESGEAGEQLVMLLPNPWPKYVKVAARINRERIRCHHVHTFNLDEYANEHGEIAPETWAFGFGHAFKKYFYAALDPELRPPEQQIHLLSNKTLADYGKRMEDLGGVDIAYVGPGWTGHLAFVDPDAPEFAAGSLAEWKEMGTRICTLSPFTIAQNSLHGCFGASGDLTAVPPKAATVGPKEILAVKHRVTMHGITVGGSFHSWQRTISRLVMHGPVTSRVPESILQTVRTDVWLSEGIAAPIETRWDLGY